jgi:hypothetical protein
MKAAYHYPLALASLALSACFAVTLTGCGSSTAPAKTTILPATNMYVISNTQVNNVENDFVLTFTTTSNGVSTPASSLTLPVGFGAYSLAVGPTGKIYVGGSYDDDPGEIMVFDAGASGAATPIDIYTGGTPGTFDYPDYIAVNDQGQLFVEADDYSIEVYSADATSGDLPAQYITTHMTSETWSEGIAADHAGNIYLDDDNVDLEQIDVFAAGATGNAVPSRSITSTATNSFTILLGITSDSAGNIMVANYHYEDDPFREVRPASTHRNPHLRHDPQASFHSKTAKAHPNTTLPGAPTAIFVFAAGASGAATPTSTLSGSSTTVNEPDYLATDALDNIYYSDYEGGTVTLMMFPAGATGNVAPKYSMTSTAYTYSWDYALTAF